METTIQKNNREIIGATYHKIRHEIFSIFRQAGIEENICEDLVWMLLQDMNSGM